MLLQDVPVTVQVEQMRQERNEKQAELDKLLATTPKELWIYDLDQFMQEWDVCYQM
jgi:hypothetical protein